MAFAIAIIVIGSVIAWKVQNELDKNKAMNAALNNAGQQGG